MPAPDSFFRYRPGSRHINDESGDQVAQVESMVEPVGKGCEVGLGVLAKLQRLVGAGQRGLEVAQHSVDPLELGQVTRLERPHHLGRVGATRLGNGSKAGQAVTEHRRFGQQAGLGPLGDGLGCEGAEQIKLHAHGLARSVERHRRHERHLVLRAAARLASSALTTEVGVVQLHRAPQSARSLLSCHGVVDLVVQQPGGGVAHPQIALEGQRRYAGLGLADEVHGQEPSRQRQLRVLHERAGGQRRLVPTGAALEQLSGAMIDRVMLSAGAARATKPARPARSANRFRALFFGAKTGQKLGDRHAVLELDLVAGHQGSPSSGELRLRAHWLTGRAC
jgi:hypothetical protein